MHKTGHLQLLQYLHNTHNIPQQWLLSWARQLCKNHSAKPGSYQYNFFGKGYQTTELLGKGH